MTCICSSFMKGRGVAISASNKVSFFDRFKEEFGDINRFDSPEELIACFTNKFSTTITIASILPSKCHLLNLLNIS